MNKIPALALIISLLLAGTAVLQPSSAIVMSGEQKVLILAAYFANQPKPARDASFYEDLVNDRVNKYYNKISYGQLSVTADAYGWYQAPVSQTCNTGPIWNFAMASAKADGAKISKYDKTILIAPFDCGWWGLGFAGSVEMSTKGSQPFTLIHELGHSFGVGHANLIDCGSVSLSAKPPQGCTTVGYGDPYSVMGHAGTMHFNAPMKERLGWLQPQLVTKSGTYTISPIELSPSALKISRGAGAGFLYIEYRQPIGYDAGISLDAQKGALFQYVGSTTGTTRLVDTSVPPKANAAVASLKPGQVFVDNNTRYKVVSLDSAKLTISITMNCSCTQPPPPVAGQVTGLKATSVKASSIGLSWTPFEGEGISYKVYRNGKTLVVTTATSITNTGLIANTKYSYQISALNAKMQEGQRSAALNVTTLP